MIKSISNTAALVIAALLLFSSCKQDDPVPVEEELITTVLVRVQQASSGFDATYTYKIENGFNSSTPGSVRADTVRLSPSGMYDVSVTLLNEKESPAENVTNEVLEEQNMHLFLYISEPATGAGSFAFSNGSFDSVGKPFNQSGKITSGTAGNGVLRLYLMHQPTNKNGITPTLSGGETDVEAVFPVRIQ